MRLKCYTLKGILKVYEVAAIIDTFNYRMVVYIFSLVGVNQNRVYVSEVMVLKYLLSNKWDVYSHQNEAGTKIRRGNQFKL